MDFRKNKIHLVAKSMEKKEPKKNPNLMVFVPLKKTVATGMLNLEKQLKGLH